MKRLLNIFILFCFSTLLFAELPITETINKMGHDCIVSNYSCALVMDDNGTFYLYDSGHQGEYGKIFIYKEDRKISKSEVQAEINRLDSYNNNGLFGNKGYSRVELDKNGYKVLELEEYIYDAIKSVYWYYVKTPNDNWYKMQYWKKINPVLDNL